MLCFILVSALCMQMVFCYGNEPNGAGAFAYTDYRGNRYGGTYSLRDGEVVDVNGDYPPDFQMNYLFPDFDSFYPYYFRNLENVLQETFESNLRYQRVALDAARKAFDLTSNQAGYISNLQNRFGPPGFSRFPPFGPSMQGFPFGMDYGVPALNAYSAYAGAAATPTFRQHVAAINPPNPNNPNVNKVEHFSANDGKPHFVSVSSSSYSSSNTVDGKTVNHRGAESTVNNNGKVTKYKVEN